MAVLVLGAYGLIGSAVAGRLQSDGFAVIGFGRDVAAARRRWPDIEWRAGDLRRLGQAGDWRPLLRNIDVVVNAAGVLQDGLGDKVAAVQDEAMGALYAAAAEAGVQRIVQISAVGAAAEASTRFLRSKAAADAALAACGVDFVILRPGLVISPRAYGGTALLRALAACPIVTPLVFADSPVQSVWIGDVADAVLAAVRAEVPSGFAADLVEREPRSLTETIRLIRSWLGEPPAAQLRLPRAAAALTSAVADLLCWLGWRSPLRSTAMSVMAGGVLGQAADGPRLLGRALKTLPESLADMPAGPQERWFARLWLAKPAILAVLSAFWLVSGALGLARPTQAAAILTSRGMAADLATFIVVTGSFVDLAAGAAVLVRPLAGTALRGMALISLLYLAGASVLVPDLWFDPLGSLLKIVPALLLALVALALLDER